MNETSECRGFSLNMFKAIEIPWTKIHMCKKEILIKENPITTDGLGIETKTEEMFFENKKTDKKRVKWTLNAFHAFLLY